MPESLLSSSESSAIWSFLSQADKADVLAPEWSIFANRPPIPPTGVNAQNGANPRNSGKEDLARATRNLMSMDDTPSSHQVPGYSSSSRPSPQRARTLEQAQQAFTRPHYPPPLKLPSRSLSSSSTPSTAATLNSGNVLSQFSSSSYSSPSITPVTATSANPNHPPPAKPPPATQSTVPSRIQSRVPMFSEPSTSTSGNSTKKKRPSVSLDNSNKRARRASSSSVRNADDTPSISGVGVPSSSASIDSIPSNIPSGRGGSTPTASSQAPNTSSHPMAVSYSLPESSAYPNFKPTAPSRNSKTPISQLSNITTALPISQSQLQSSHSTAKGGSPSSPAASILSATPTASTKSRLAAAKPQHPQPLLSTSQKKANHIQSEQKRRANIRRGYEALCEIVPALRDAIRAEEEVARLDETDLSPLGPTDDANGEWVGEGEREGSEITAGTGAGTGSTGGASSAAAASLQAARKKARGKAVAAAFGAEEGEKVDGRAGPRSEAVVLQKSESHHSLFDRLQAPSALLFSGIFNP